MRLIDADALAETLAIVAKKMAKSDAQKALMGRVLYIIDHKPEQVARCRECKHITPVEGGLPLCALHNIACAHNDFCSYGERKDGDS